MPLDVARIWHDLGMGKFQVTGKLVVELGILVEAEDAEEARQIAEDIDLDNGWIEVQDDFEIFDVSPWVAP